MENLSKAMEQYLETIYKLESENQGASVSDIAEARGVKAPSVTYVLRKLSKPEYDLVNYEKYNREVTLTKKGRKIAEKLERTHETLRWFFVAIGVDSKLADEEACEIEHIVHPKTVEMLLEFVDWLKNDAEVARLISRFRSRK